MSLERLDKIIASQGTLTRSDARRLVRCGAVTINNTTAADPALKVDIEHAQIRVNGKLLNIKKQIYIMMNKPQGVVSASQGETDITVVDLVPDELKRDGLFPAGRLDKDTVGFVLITDDGDFAHQILSPKKHVEKTYEAILDKSFDLVLIEKFKKGIHLYDDTVCLPAKLNLLEDTVQPKVQIKICEGKYHQIKRMFAANGYTVVHLKRTMIGGLELDKSLKPGACREITADELNRIQC